MRKTEVIGLAVFVSVLAGMVAAVSAQQSPKRAHVAGQVRVAGQPAAGWRVELHQGSPRASRRLDAAVTGGNGKFKLRRRRAKRNSILYIVAKRGESDRLLAVLGKPKEIPKRVVVNELSTVASIWTSAQFLDGESISGNAVGLVAAARNVPSLVDPKTGQPGAVVQNAVNGTRTTTLATLNTLASLLSDCLRGTCGNFFELATPPGEPPATDTMQALQYVALNPWHNVTEIFALRPPAIAGHPGNPVFIPTLLWPPTAWTLSLVYAEGGFNAPGGMSIDAEGNLWTNNNFIPGSQSVLLDVGGVLVPDPLTYVGTGVTKLRSDGLPLSPPTGFLGGGTFGAAFGIAIDQRGHVFVGNFAGDSVSELLPDGSPVSPDPSSPYGSDGGYRDPQFDDIQSTIVDHEGSVWVTNLGGNTVSQMVEGNPSNIRTWGGTGCPVGFARPWGLASDQQGQIWVTNSAANTVSVIDPAAPPEPGGQRCPATEYPLGGGPASAPWGIAVDLQGNVWAAQLTGRTITLLRAADGFAATAFDAGGTAVSPWGIAIDGANNVWVSDFFGKRILHLCGTSANCPLGRQSAGDRISPPGRSDSGAPGDGGGYGANGAIQSITSVVVDQAGNVWLANNFDNDEICLAGAAIPPAGEASTVVEERLQPMCGGNGAVVMFGVAAPVAAPLIGPPVQP